ncbi:MAG: DUF1501 domain-containing protein [Planctomycetes bacterium]|nr:DUF1501 domain-containing protein [Planctomycetota bacterium]
MIDVTMNRSASRRDFLRVGGLSAFGLSLADYLQAAAPVLAPTRKKNRASSVILVYLGGGISHHDSFDLKPDAPEEIRGIYKPIASNVPGLQVGELLPNMAKTMDKVALIRSAAHNNDHHETATNWVMSGRFGSAFGDYPAIGAVVAHESGFAGTLPPYVSVPRNPSFTWELGKSAFLGGRYESFKAGDPNAKDYKVQDVAPSEAISPKRAERRQNLLEAVDGLARKVQANDQIATYDEFRQRASDMLLSGEGRRAFAIEEEPEKLRDRYGRTTFGQSCLLARRLVAGGVRFVTVNFGGWDHHAKIWDGLQNKLPDFDRGFSALIDDLHERGMLSNTLVVAMGEFGRTPKINKDNGRDHWAPAGSLLMAGAGVKPGNVIGATDRQGAYATKRPVAPADVAFTVFDSLGIDPRKQIVTPDGRPLEILDQGESVKELF